MKPKLSDITNEFKLDQNVQASGYSVEEESLLLEVEVECGFEK